MGELEWTNDVVVRLMQEYASRPELWNPLHELYRVQTLKYESWRALARQFGCDVASLRKKLNSLLASYRREKGKVRASGRSSWFLYQHMSFLPTHVDCTSDAEQRLDKSDKMPVSSKSRVPIKEAGPPSSDEEEEEEEEPDFCEEFLEDEELPDEVLIKEEPLQAAARPRAGCGGRAARRERPHAKPRLTRPVRRRREPPPAPAAARAAPDRLAEALRLLRRAGRAERTKDECDSFGEYIADSLRKHDDRTQSMIKQAINNILFEQEMKKYNSQQFVVIAGMDENPLILTDETEK